MTEGIATEIQKGKRRFSLTSVLMNRYFLYMISLTVFFLIWEVVAIKGLLGMPRLEAVYNALIEIIREPLAGKTLFGHVLASFSRVCSGFAIAVVIGIPTGLLMATNRYVNGIVKPIFDMLKPMPPIAWIPIAILWFGVGETSKIFLIAIGTIIPCIINTYNGIRLVQPELYEVISVLGGNRRDMVLQVTFPAAFPAIFSGMQLAFSFAWACVVAAELVSSRAGVGFLIILGMKTSDSALIIASMGVIAVIAWSLSMLLGKLENRICPWKKDIVGL